eukprot:17556-Heterococcus_DN1.PRE.3
MPLGMSMQCCRLPFKWKQCSLQSIVATCMSLASRARAVTRVSMSSTVPVTTAVRLPSPFLTV